MKNILSLLYQGKISPIEQYAPKSEEYRKAHQAHLHHYDDFIETLASLNPPLDKRFVEIMEEQSALIPYEFSEMFIDGFRMGAKMMMEILKED